MSSVRKFPMLMTLVCLVSVAAWSIGCGGDTAAKPTTDAGNAAENTAGENATADADGQAADTADDFGFDFDFGNDGGSTLGGDAFGGFEGEND